jgi:site-specific recombinase XerD
MSEALPAVIGPSTQDMIAANLARHARMAEGASAVETGRALRKASKGFADWTSARGLLQVPAAVEAVVEYVDWLAEAGKKASTIRQAVWAISQLHVQARITDPTKDQDVKLALKRMARQVGTRQNQAAPLGQEEVDRILAAAGETPADLRNVALLLTMRDLLARRSEVVALEVADIEVGKAGIVTATIRRSKTDKFGEGVSKWIDPETHAAILRWLEVAGIETGPIFRSVNKGGRVGAEAILPGDVARILKGMAKAAGLDHTRISGHSARVGAAQDLAASGTELPALMTAGRWKTATMPARYVEKLAEGRGAMATYKAKLKAKRQGGERNAHPGGG